MANSHSPKPQSSEPSRFQRNGSLSSTPQATGATGINTQPVGSFVKFGKVAGKPVFWEFANGKPRKSSSRYGAGKTGRDYYKEGDFFAEGDLDLRTLKRLFPDAKLESKDFDFWDSVAIATGDYEQNKIPLLRRIDKISINETEAWSGIVQTSFYIVVDKSIIPLTGKNTQQVLTARPGAGTLNDKFAIAPLIKQMEFLQEVIAGEIRIVTELSLSALTGVASKSLKGVAILQKLSKAKYSQKILKALKNLSKYIDQKKLLRASAAFAGAFYKSLESDLKKYTLHQLAGKEEKAYLDLKTDNKEFNFEEGSSISPNKSGQQHEFGKAYIPLKQAPTFNINKAIIAGVAAFAHSLIVVDNLAEPISKEVTKRVLNTEMRKDIEKFLNKFISNLGEKLWSDAISTAAQKAMEDPQKQSSYPKHLEKELTDRLISLMTEDLVGGILKVAAFGFDD